MKYANFLVLTALSLPLAACVGSVPLQGKACPCTTDFVCCESTHQCVARGSDCGKSDAGISDAPAGDTFNPGIQNAIGRPCDLTVNAGPTQGVYNASASECPSNLCLKPVVEPGSPMSYPSTQSLCSAECTWDSDCDGELRDPSNPLDQRCMNGFACGIPFVKGEICCKKLCMCKDFLGPSGVPTPVACEGAGAATCAGSQPISNPSGVAQQTDIYITIAPNRQLDLVFMVDNSPSMAPKVAKMNAQFPKLIEALKDPSDNTLPDLRVAIIDSDLGTGGQYTSGSCGPRTLSDGTPSSYGDLGRFQMIGAAACGVNNPSATYLELTKNAPVNFTGDINTVFACLAGNLGTAGCGEEHQLQSVEFALVAGGLGAVNDAQHLMLRPSAYLGLVFLTDEDDCSAATNEGMFGQGPPYPGPSGLGGESSSLRCYSRSHECNNKNLADNAPPGYPTTGAFTAPLTSCSARTDACDNPTDGANVPGTDTSVPTTCSPLKDYKRLAAEIKGLKEDPDNQILVAGIFGWPLSDADVANAQYKIDLIPNQNTADTAHPTVYDSWPVCYDPNHMPAAATTDKTTGFDPTAAGYGATAGLRMSAFVDEFAPNGLKFSICQPDFTDSMKLIGDSIVKKLQNLCVDYKLWHDTNGAPDCRVVFRTPDPIDPRNPTVQTYTESPISLPMCDAGATNGKTTVDCWQLTSDTTKCPSAFNGQVITVLRTKDELANYPLPPGTKIGMQCRTCPSLSSTADSGCAY
jgi:hypothetical protein